MKWIKDNTKTEYHFTRDVDGNLCLAIHAQVENDNGEVHSEQIGNSIISRGTKLSRFLSQSEVGILENRLQAITDSLLDLIGFQKQKDLELEIAAAEAKVVELKAKRNQ